MKRGTDLLLKFKLLKTRLDIPAWQAKGLLQSIWDFTAENAPMGDIGKFTNEEIAIGIEYDGDADELLQVLLQSKWVDADSTHRLVVHDWLEHCEEWIKKRLERKGLMEKRRTTADNGRRCLPTAANGCLPDPDPDPDPVPDPEPCVKTNTAQRGNSTDNYTTDFEQFWAAYPKRKNKGQAWKAWKALKPSHTTVQDMLACLPLHVASSQWLKDNGQYIPYPATWLNARGWEDEVENGNGKPPPQIEITTFEDVAWLTQEDSLHE